MHSSVSPDGPAPTAFYPPRQRRSSKVVCKLRWMFKITQSEIFLFFGCSSVNLEFFFQPAALADLSNKVGA